jgi:flagellar hook assembly protein FlgD
MINYQLPMISYVTLKIYDILGREVKSLINGLQQAGTHSINFNGSKMASGVYFYRLQINNNKGFYAETKKMLLIR